MKKWNDRLRNVYTSYREFLSYCEIYDIHSRLGYETPKEAWKENPVIEGSTDPNDLKVKQK